MLEAEPKKLDARCWSRSLKFEYGLHTPGPDTRQQIEKSIVNWIAFKLVCVAPLKIQ